MEALSGPGWPSYRGAAMALLPKIEIGTRMSLLPQDKNVPPTAGQGCPSYRKLDFKTLTPLKRFHSKFFRF